VVACVPAVDAALTRGRTHDLERFVVARRKQLATIGDDGDREEIGPRGGPRRHDVADGRPRRRRWPR
jgi:hypothetical protein